MSETFRINQRLLAAGADVLYAANILRPDADPTAIMCAVAHMLQAIDRVRPRNERQANDIDPLLVRRIVASV